MPLQTFAAFTTRGLEDVAADEISTAPLGIEVVESRTKVVLTKAADPKAFRRLRTVDDVAAVFAQSPELVDAAALTALVAGEGDVEGTLTTAGRTHAIDGTFSVTVSAAHTELGSADEIERVVARAVQQRYGWEHLQMQRSPVDIRVFIDGTWALLAVRVFDEPLSRRAYRLVNLRGALRPTVAAALVRLALPDGKPQRVWDPFCGSGTILCEALTLGHDVWGTDIEAEAVDASRANVASVNREFWGRVENADSTAPRTWQKHKNATAVIANLPWGKQVAIKSKQTLYDTVGTGVADLARRGGTSVLLTTDPDRVLQRLKREKGVTVDTRRIGMLGQTPTIVRIVPVK